MMRIALLGLVACSDPYIVVTVEGANPELTVAPVEVRVGFYGDDRRIDFDYTARLEPREEGGVPATDFVVVLRELNSEAQLRVAIPTITTTWFADARITEAGAINLPLFAGERAVTTASLGNGDHETSVLFGTGIAIAWVDSGGVQVRIERDPDRLISRAEVVVADSAAKGLRLGSRRNALGYGPDLYVVGWVGGDGMARVRVTTLTMKYLVRDLGPAEELSIGGAFKGAAFAAAIATRAGGTLRVLTINDSGVPTPPLDPGLVLGAGATAIVGVAVTREGILVGWRANGGSRLTLVGNDGTIRGEQLIDGDLIGLSLTSDASRLLTLQRRQLELFQVTYFPTLDPTGVEVDLGPISLGSRASLSECVAAWPEVRNDGTNVTDLRFAILDADGLIDGEPHLLNSEDVGDHIAPTAVCASQTRAYATFFERAAITDPVARLRLRRIPTY